MDSIKYRYAYNLENQIIDVFNLDPTLSTRNQVFCCISCGLTLIPVLGEKKQKHFRHKVDVVCSTETYLHKLAKQKIFERLQKCLEEKKPFFIEYSAEEKCSEFQKDSELAKELNWTCKFTVNKKFDLTKYYSQISLEKKVGDFVPDILLNNERGKNLFIEICVTKKSSSKKIDSQTKIIEIYLKNEEDFKKLEKSLEKGFIKCALLNTYSGKSKIFSNCLKVILYNFRASFELKECHDSCRYQTDKDVAGDTNISPIYKSIDIDKDRYYQTEHTSVLNTYKITTASSNLSKKNWKKILDSLDDKYVGLFLYHAYLIYSDNMKIIIGLNYYVDDVYKPFTHETLINYMSHFYVKCQQLYGSKIVVEAHTNKNNSVVWKSP